MAAPNSVEMKVNRELMSPDFEGYKLSLDSVPVFSTGLQSLIKMKSCDDDQYSYLHAKLFSSVNALVHDPHNRDEAQEQQQEQASSFVYLVDGEQDRVFKIADKCEEGTKAELTKIWSAPASDGQVAGAYNASLVFPDAEHAVYADGRGVVYVLQTGNRSSSENWKTIFHDEICGPERPFAVVSSRRESETLHVLLMYVANRDEVENLREELKSGSASNYVNVAEWITLDVSSVSSCKLDRVRRYVLFGEVDLLELIQDGSGQVRLACLGEQKPVQLVYDSIGIEEEEQEPAKEASDTKDTLEQMPAFFWQQGPGDMVVWVPLPTDQGQVASKEIKVKLQPSHMSVVIRGQTILDGKLFGVLDTDSMTWTIDRKTNRLEITMEKVRANEGLVWQRFLADKDIRDGEEVSNPAMIDAIQEQLAHLTSDNPMADPTKEDSVFNAQELEACDEDGGVAKVYRIFDGTKVGHLASVWDRQLLMKMVSDTPGMPVQLCLRHDVDGLVWQPRVVEDASTDCKLILEHVDTISAFGYVQASKTQRTFTVASPDRSYAAIIDRTRHVYIYRKPEPISTGCELRNRKSGQQVQKVAKQQVITLEPSNEAVLGAVATNKTLFVVTASNLNAIKIH